MADVKQEFRELAVALRETIEQKFGTLVVKDEEAFVKINELMDENTELKNRVNDLEFQLKKWANANQHNDNAQESAEELAEFKDDLLKFVRKEGREQLAQKQAKFKFEGKSTNLVRSDLAAAGALLLPPEIGQDIMKNVVEASPIMSLARVTNTTSGTFKRRVRTETPGASWLAEEAAGAKAKPTYDEVPIPVHKLAARYAMSIEMEQDSAYDLVQELIQAASEDFAKSLGSAFITGNGTNKPTGIVGNVTNMNSGSLSLSTDLLIKMQEQIKESYQNNASWVFTRKTRAYIRSLILSSTNGLQYTWEPDFQRKSPTLLLGSPVYIAAEGDLAGKTSGNFTANDVPILYGDFSRGYEAVVNTNMYVIDDPYSEASAFVRNLNVMGRFGGNVTLEEAIVQLTMTSS